MPAEEEGQPDLMRAAIAAVARASRLVGETRSAIGWATALMRRAAPRVRAEQWTDGMRTCTARAFGELEVARRAADRLADDITSAAFNLARATGDGPDVRDLLAHEEQPPPRQDEETELLGRAVDATARSAALAEAARSAVDSAATLVRAAITTVRDEDWTRRGQVDAALVGVRAAARGAGALATRTASARRSLTAATGRVELVRDNAAWTSGGRGSAA